MIAVVVLFKLFPGHNEQMHMMAPHIISRLQNIDGFINAVTYFKEDQSEFGMTSLWKSKDAYKEFTVNSDDSFERLIEWSREPISINIYDVGDVITSGEN